ncbi:MAG: AAA family ATPase [Candidatus Rokubacteria bacterium]|nr:AAA family ATPase [Candidatus Rokubacteria bacterium]
MQCPHCTFDNPQGMAFCGRCGAKLASLCPSCGFANPEGFGYCGRCGSRLTTEAARPSLQPPAAFASPQAYTPKHLAEKILTSRSALEGERKQVTVLFADLKGSMELLADRDPEEARKILDPILERMMEAVHRYEGTVNQVMGDGIMALFGAPLAHEDHAVRACYAALRMQESVARYAEDLRRSQGLDIQIRVGLNSGEVVVRSIGSDLRMDYTAVGQTTHLAARMEQLARPGTTLLTADTLRLAEGYVEVKPLGPVPVKGLPEPLETYELLRAGSARSKLQAATARGLTRFVGRNAEIEALRHTLNKARNGHGQVVAVVGEPGVGKSRLFWEFTHSHRTQGWLVLESGSVSYGKATPYFPVLDLLKAYFQIEGRDDTRKIREKLTGKVLSLDRALESSLPALLSLLDAPAEDDAWDRLDPPQRRQRTLDGVKRLLLRESQVQPLLVLFEDLHWIDTETQACLDSLVETLPTARLLLLVNYRPEYQHGWGSKTYFTQLRIDPLPPESCEELLQALLGDGAGLQPLKQLLIERTEGNPFFLEESVRTLVETKVLVGERGAYRLAKALPSIQVPATVQAVLAARIDRLLPQEKTLLQTAAVIGKDVPFALLQAIAELAEGDLRRGLAHLQAVEFLYESSLFPDLEYTFKHALTHEVAYGSLLQQRRHALHAQIMEAIERLYPDRLAEQVDRLAHHALRGEVWGKALTYFRQAGAKAASRSAYREAVTCFEQALIALRRLPETRSTIEQDIDLRLDLRNAYLPLGELERIFEHLSTAEALASALDDQLRLGKVLGYLSTNFLAAANNVRAIDAGERALSIAVALGDSAQQIEMWQRLAFVYHLLGDYSRAIDLGRRVLDSVVHDPHGVRFGPMLTSVISRIWLGWSLAERGDFADAIALTQEAGQIADQADYFSQAFACWVLGLVHFSRGDVHRAIPPLERGLQLCQVAQVSLLFPLTTSWLGSAYALSGRMAEGQPLLEQAVEQAANFRGWQSQVIINLGQGSLLAGRVEDAMRLAESALELTRERKERGSEARALRLLGEIASHQDPREVEKADTHYREALALGDELGMRPLMAHCHLGLGKLYRRTGKRQQAQEHLTTAATMFREMDMGFWLAQAEAELKALG